jgi:hypothetical protein
VIGVSGTTKPAGSTSLVQAANKSVLNNSTGAGAEVMSAPQDLNSDGVMSPASHVEPSTPAAPVTSGSGNTIPSGSAVADNFVFNADLGSDAVKGSEPGIDRIDIDHALYPSISDLPAHTTDNAGGDATVTSGIDSPTTFDSISKAVLEQHASGFHLI